MIDVEAGLDRALHLAENLGDVDHQLRTLAILHDFKRHRESKAVVARKFFALAATPADRLYGEFMEGAASYWFGDLSTARHRLERVIAHGPVSGRRAIRAFEQPLARAYLAPVLWLLGFPQKAIDLAKDAADEAQAVNRALTLCRSLARAGCPVALWAGDLELAEHYIDLLIDESTRNGLPVRRALGNAYRGMLFVRRGDLPAGVALLRGSVDELEKREATVAYRMFMLVGELAAALGRAGRLAEGLATIDDAIDRSGRADELWIMPELLRIKGELLFAHGSAGAADEADACFRQALDWAERQGALSWQLRAATSLARLLQGRGRAADAIARLAPVYDRFTEGFDTADLTAARALLNSLKS